MGCAKLSSWDGFKEMYFSNISSLLGVFYFLWKKTIIITNLKGKDFWCGNKVLPRDTNSTGSAGWTYIYFKHYATFSVYHTG